MPTSTRMRWARLVAVAGVLLAAVLWPVLFGGPDVADIRAAVDGAGALAPLAFVGLYAVLTILVVPGAALTIAAGALFGPLTGTLLAVVGATLGATAAYLVARRLGRTPLVSVTGERMARIDRWLVRRGFAALLVARLVPLVPFNVLNYAAGLTDVRPRAYVTATALGIVPGAFAYAALGGSLDDPLSGAFLGAVALVALLGVAGAVAARRLGA